MKNSHTDFKRYDDLTVYRVIFNENWKTVIVVAAFWLDYTKEERQELEIDENHQYSIFVTSRDGEKNKKEEKLVEDAIDLLDSSNSLVLKDFLSEEEARKYIESRTWIHQVEKLILKGNEK